ncbi:T9SS C-terminal target domain-containing protein [Flavobacteriaceae bacterium AU392]|nr:T9SS C-terminal target domain-containing protein [Flavobacteriaceae bacterium]RKM82717.1 T9SS C-terminal target domain-containing protein [Flavobacteriaceae bacterium AU392]
MKRKLHILFTVVIIMVAVNLSFSQTTYFVDASQPDDSGDGTSWATATRNLQPALDAAVVGDEIRVASGTYFPTESPDGNVTESRDRAFHFNRNITLLGSFNPATNTQDLSNPSILSGDFNTDDVVTGLGESLNITGNAENPFHVLITANLTDATTINGFTVQGGNASGSGDLTYSSQSFRRDSGGGMYHQRSSPNVSDMIFFGNSCRDLGGGLFYEALLDIRFTVSNAVFTQNQADSTAGGLGILGANGDNVVENSIFRGNRTLASGGAMSTSFLTLASGTTVTNVLFEDNDARSGGAISTSASETFIVKNCMFLNNSASPISAIDEDATGGAIRIQDGGNPTMIGNVFIGNTAFWGGAVFGSDLGSSPSSARLTTYINNIFYNNIADEIAGAIFHFNQPYNIINNVFIENRTVFLSGAFSTIAVGGTGNGGTGSFTSTITNSTFFANGINDNSNFVVGGNFDHEFNNNVFWGDPNGNDEIFVSSTSAITGRNNFAQNFEGTGFTTLTSDPFINSNDPDGPDDVFGTLDDGLFPAENSPLIDGGANLELPLDTFDIDNDGDTTERLPIDITGAQRIVQIGGLNRVDGGAYEFNTTLSIGDNVLNNRLLFYPNPVQDEIILRNEQNLILEKVDIYDITGRLIQTYDIKNLNRETLLDVSSLNTGNYLLIITGDRGRITKKLVKE